MTLVVLIKQIHHITVKSYMIIYFFKISSRNKTAANTLTITFRRIIKSFLQHNADVKQ